MTGIYQFYNMVKHKYYVGKSVDIIRRWREHLNCGESSLTDDELHYDLYNFYDNFAISILELCEEEELSEREEYWINYLKKNKCELYNKIAAESKISAMEVPRKQRTQKDIIKFLNKILGRPLFKEDKDVIVRFFNYRDKRGNLLKWNTIKKKLLENGFEVMETKRVVDGVNKNCSIINVKFNYLKERIYEI